MSFAKRLLERQQAQRSAAISIALTGGSLKRCEWHDDIVMDAGLLDHSYTYRVGNAKMKAGELGDLFDSPREMTDVVKAAIDEHALGYCPRCDKQKED
jgi:hypothetical protein